LKTLNPSQQNPRLRYEYDRGSGYEAELRLTQALSALVPTDDLIHPDHRLFQVSHLITEYAWVAIHHTLCDLEAALEGTVDLVTTSALLDLVSDRWLQRLAEALAARAIPFYAALSYDGQVGFTPSDPFDGAIIDAVNQHQRTDKGFGAALGPEAADAALACFEALGYSVMTGSSGWIMGPQDRDMQAELVDGWASAARDIGTLSDKDITAWSMRRRAMIAAGQSSCRVGHVDCFAVPSATR